MEGHQRRVWEQMLRTLDEYEMGTLTLARLVEDLPGYLAAADMKKRDIIDGFWDVFSPIEGEHELRTEPWAPPNSASDERLAEAVRRFRAWATGVLAHATQVRE